MKNAAIAAKMAALPSIPEELIDQFVSGPTTADAVNAATVAFKKALVERGLGAEMSRRHLPEAVAVAMRPIYRTNPIETISVHLSKIIKTPGHFPGDDAASKLIWLVLRNTTVDGGQGARDWKDAMNQISILCDRFMQPTHGTSKQGG